MTPYYIKHPVSDETKKALNIKGYRILDIKFAPSNWVDPENKPKRVSRKVKADEQAE